MPVLILKTIANLGIYSAVAVFFAFFATVTLLPAALAVLPVKASIGSERSQRPLERVFNLLIRLSSKHYKIISVSAFLLLIACFAIASNFRFANDFISYFPKESDIYKDVYVIDDALDGSSRIEVIIDGNREGVVFEPEFLRKLEHFESMFSNKVVKGIMMGDSYSILNIYRETHKALHENDS